MLRRVIFKNFVHFKDKQELDFAEIENEPIFFVGANSTGKTAAMELIRRCLDSKRNASLTARTNPDSKAYVFCEFSMKDNGNDSTVITGILVDDKYTEKNNDAKQENKDHREDQKCKNEDSYDDKTDTMFHKIVICLVEKNVEVSYETFLEKPAPQRIVPYRSTMKLAIPLPGKLDDMITQKDFAEKQIEDILLKIKNDLKEKRSYEENKEHPLLLEINRKFVATFPMRGIGAVQWTHSEKISGEYRERNYKSTCEQAEIITELLDNTNLIDTSKAERIFRYLTDGKDIKFEKTSDGSINVLHGKKTFPLLKASVGVVEAEQFSLLMAYKNMKTICLEEPNRGMHPQMIHCMNVVLHEESRDKRIIVVTHSPYLIDLFWCKGIFFFNGENILSMPITLNEDRKTQKKRKNVEHEDSQTQKKTKYVEHEDSKTQKKPKYLEHEDRKILYFCSKLLLVEGKTDKRVLEGLFRHLFTNFTPETIERDRKILSNQIFFCEGRNNVKQMRGICDGLKIKCREVLDRDAVIEMDNRGLIEKIEMDGKREFEFFTDKPIADFLKKEFIFENNNWRCEDKINSSNGTLKMQPFQKLSDDLKKNGIFIWKDGDLEDVLLSKRESRKEICEALCIPDDKQETRKKLKQAIKDALSADPSRDQLEKFTKTIIDFEEVDRLMDFLGNV